MILNFFEPQHTSNSNGAELFDGLGGTELSGPHRGGSERHSPRTAGTFEVAGNTMAEATAIEVLRAFHLHPSKSSSPVRDVGYTIRYARFATRNAHWIDHR